MTMKFFHSINILIWLSGLFIFSQVNTFADDIYQVTTNSVTVREGPGASYSIVDKLDKGTFAIITSNKGEWARIYYIKTDMDGKYGWINRKYLSAAKTFDDVDSYDYGYGSLYDEKIDLSDANLALNITDADFKCTKRVIGGGFDKCILEINYTLSSDYDRKIYVNITCDAEFILYYENKFNSKRKNKSESDYIYLYGGYTIHSMDIILKPSYYENLIKAEVEEISCRASVISQ